ncbi:hypothetical protein JXB02_00720 [Candidatus Woesearchaeota archaeon]|nr:hypothetical protein [Candidatus Woesearchaeota archaeon]
MAVWKTNLRNAIGVVLILLGLLGIMLPIVPGLLLIVTGLLFIDKKRAQYFSDYYRNIERRLFDPLMLIGVGSTSIGIATLFWMEATYTHLLLITVGIIITSYNFHEIRRYFH